MQRKEKQSQSDTLNNTILTNLSSIQNTSVESTLSSSSASSLNSNKKKSSDTNLSKGIFVVQVPDKKQTYV